MTDNSMEKEYNHIEAEKNWYQIWEKNGLFRADNTLDSEPFSIILPPPNVTGSLHMGHALTFTIPDIIMRRKKMQGYNTLWLPGIDHAGIATQMMVERELKKEKGLTKEDLGRDKFLKIVWEFKEESKEKIIRQINKLGLSLDWSRMKFTLSDEMRKVVTKVFVDLYNEGKIYQDTYIVNLCPSCKTVLSDLEVNYREYQGKLTYIKYPLQTDPQRYITVATTRPETMLGDTAVAVNPEDERFSDLIDHNIILPLTNRTIKVIADDTVDKEFGTGAVKITPAHDPNDFNIAIRHNLQQIEVIDKTGTMTGPIPEKYLGLDRFECRHIIIADLKKLDLIEKIEDYAHNVGSCQRCETIIEPNVSKQWFLKTSELALKASQAVRNKKITFIPEKWEKVYFSWMDNIQDWCISRQLWWGHRIPAYYCRNCNHLIVAEEKPVDCPECQSSDIEQDKDVLDTWFSSALWPFSTLGSMTNHRDFQVYYPTSLMVTGFDIIFFWVARMIMMGIHFGRNIPFREVLLNGLIRDEKGQKMSKTKNNAVDPLDIIKQFGSDALRFNLAIQAVPGMDISLSIDRIRGYKAFANKIWNASRYVIMNLKGDEDFNIDTKEISSTDKWVLNYLNNTIEKVNLYLDDYRLNEAADVLYHFFWHEYCDWYLEFSKNDLAHINTRKVLKYTLFTLLQLLHPFMPFLTEEIYQKLKTDQNFLILTKFPSFSSDHIFTEEYLNIELIKKIIMETRKTRTENKIDPNQRVTVFLKTDSGKEEKIVKDNIKYFDFLTKSSDTKIVSQFPEQKKGFKGVCQKWEIVLPFDNDQDRFNELNRLKKELEKIEIKISSLEKKLANKDFINKAPEKVVSEFKNNLMEAIEKREKLDKTIKDLS